MLTYMLRCLVMMDPPNPATCTLSKTFTEINGLVLVANGLFVPLILTSVQIFCHADKLVLLHVNPILYRYEKMDAIETGAIGAAGDGGCGECGGDGGGRSGGGPVEMRGDGSLVGRGDGGGGEGVGSGGDSEGGGDVRWAMEAAMTDVKSVSDSVDCGGADGGGRVEGGGGEGGGDTGLMRDADGGGCRVS